MSPENSAATVQVKHLQRSVIRLKRIILFLSMVLMAIGAIYVYNNWYDNSVPWSGRANDADANPKMHNFRRGIHINRRSMGVYYSAEAVQNYLDSHFKSLIKEQEQYQDMRRRLNRPDSFPYARYKWKIGFYWMMKKDTTTEGNANKLDFYVIPTLVDSTDPLGVIDYYKDYKNKDSVYYHGKNTDKSKKDPLPDGFAFDEGQLWP